jgi:Flp pilus assembly protein TadB
MGLFDALVALASAVLLRPWRWGERAAARERLAELPEAVEELSFDAPSHAPFARRHRLLPWLPAAALGIAVYFLFGHYALLAAAATLMAGMLGSVLEAAVYERRMLTIEQQLADSIDLLVASLRAGSGLLPALENAAIETRAPLRTQLAEVVGRIRLGDRPQDVFRGLVARVPLENFVLFATALSVHWDVGGSLAPTLATVGRTIRDRIELSRRVRAMTAQARLSMVVVLLVVYFIAGVMWLNDAERMETFLSTSLGMGLAAGTALMQALGILWASRISRLNV